MKSNNDQATTPNYMLDAEAALHRAHGLRGKAIAETIGAIFGRKLNK